MTRASVPVEAWVCPVCRAPRVWIEQAPNEVVLIPHSGCANGYWMLKPAKAQVIG